MVLPESYYAGKEVSEGISKGLAQLQDSLIMDELLRAAKKNQAQGQQDPFAMEQLLGRLSPERQPQGQRIAGIGQQGRESRALSGITGIPQEQISGLNPKQKEIVLENYYKSKQKGTEDKTRPIKTGLSLLKRQRELLERGNLGPVAGIWGVGTGRKTGSTWTKQGRIDRAEYERLGKSLISLSTTMQIRNQSEFDKLAAGLYDPKATQEEIEGNILGMERLLRENLGEYESANDITQNIPAGQLSDAQIDALLMQTGGNIQQAMQLLNR